MYDAKSEKSEKAIKSVLNSSLWCVICNSIRPENSDFQKIDLVPIKNSGLNRRRGMGEEDELNEKQPEAPVWYPRTSDQNEIERRTQIMETLKTRPHARICELSDQFRVSSETIRKDLDYLSQKGLLPRGRCSLLAQPGVHRVYPDMDTRSAIRLEEREKIGLRAAKLVMPGSTLMMDAGTTTLQMARMLTMTETPCTVITNSLPIAMTLGQSRNTDVVLCPGDYLAPEAAVAGSEALAFLERHTVDACFIGASAVDERGASEAIRSLAILKTAMLAAAKTRYLLAGREKFGQRDLMHISALDELNGLICDDDPDPEFGEVLNAAGLSVYAGAGPAIQSAPVQDLY